MYIDSLSTFEDRGVGKGGNSFFVFCFLFPSRSSLGVFPSCFSQLERRGVVISSIYKVTYLYRQSISTSRYLSAGMIYIYMIDLFFFFEVAWIFGSLGVVRWPAPPVRPRVTGFSLGLKFKFQPNKWRTCQELVEYAIWTSGMVRCKWYRGSALK